MQALLHDKCNAIRAQMRTETTQTFLTDDLRRVILALLLRLDEFAAHEKGDSETQKSSSRTENAVLEMLGVPQIFKTPAKSKTLSSIPSLTGDYFGFVRSVEHRNECRFAMPDADGVYVIHQPFGSQTNPDLLLVDVRDKRIVSQFGIEIKSGGPTWNTHIQFADRSMLYVAFKGETHYFFGEHVRSQESMILALAWDELQRELAGVINADAKAKTLPNLCVAYPKQEFRCLDLNVGRDERHAEIKAWLQASLAPSL